MRSFAVIMLAAQMLLGCVVYPTQRTYFEPNAMDGVPTPSQSCGYHNAKNDALVREVDGLHIQVTPHLEEGKPLSVTVLFRAPTAADVSLEKHELRSLVDGATFLPVSQKITTYAPDKTHPYYSRWVTLQFQPVPEHLTEIAIVFPIGSVSLNGQVFNLAPFRFRKVTRSDVYYGSINC